MCIRDRTAAVLSVLSVYLTFSGHGYIIVPTSGSWITVIHLPTILAGILGGWVAGGLVGLVFGVSAMVYAAQSDGKPEGRTNTRFAVHSDLATHQFD